MDKLAQGCVQRRTFLSEMVSRLLVWITFLKPLLLKKTLKEIGLYSYTYFCDPQI
jgi:hypothetical protein